MPFPGYGSQPCVVLVNASTVRKDIPYDATCILRAGCHPFVVAESYVRYQDARIYRADEPAARVAQGLFSPHEPMAQSTQNSGTEPQEREPRKFGLRPQAALRT